MADEPMVVVRGEAFKEVPPEQAIFSVTVSARDKDRQVALTQLTERAAGLRRALDDHADAIERRETGGVQIYPDMKRGSERVVAYTGSVATTVTVTDFGVLGDLLLRLARLEQASVAGPWWQLRPGSKAGADVRQTAIFEALTRARDYAAAVGAQIDRLLEIADDGTSGGPQPMMRMAAFGVAEDSAQRLELDPQPQTVQASVIVRVTITEPAIAP